MDEKWNIIEDEPNKNEKWIEPKMAKKNEHKSTDIG